jgi:hypothetical protein
MSFIFRCIQSALTPALSRSTGRGSIPLAAIKILKYWPTWLIWVYVSIAVVMAICLTIVFLRTLRRRREKDRGAMWVVVGIVFFPLMALSIIWPVTLPFALVAIRRNPPKDA